VLLCGCALSLWLNNTSAYQYALAAARAHCCYAMQW
jgi:hypothetical protein